MFTMMSTYLIVQKRNPQYWVYPSKPQLIGYFAEPRFRSEETKFPNEQNALGSLKYLNKHADLNAMSDSFQILKTIAKRFQKPLEFTKTGSLKPLENWISNHSEIEEVKRAKYFMDRESLTTILNTPLKTEWTLFLKYVNKAFYLFMNKEISTEYLICLEALNNCLFNDMPDRHTQVTMREDDLFFYEVYEIQVGGKTIIYSAKIPGVDCDKVVNNLEELKAATHVDLDICWETRGILPECLSCCTTWTKAALISAEHVIIAHPTHLGYTVNGKKVELMNSCSIQRTTIDDLIDAQNKCITYKTYKAPEFAWNFLDDFLTFAEREVVRGAETSTSLYEFKLEMGSAVSCRRIEDISSN